jgi:hypothetical protein
MNKEKIKERLADYYQNNKDTIKERSTKRFNSNKKEILEQQKSYYKKNKSKLDNKNREYAIEHKEEIKLYREKYNKENSEKLSQQQQEYYKNNKIEINKKSKEYRLKNAAKIKQYDLNRKDWKKNYIKIYRKNKMESDPLFKFEYEIRCLISKSIKRSGFKKNKKSEEILGCTFEEFKQYLESKFESWMSWSNHGNWNGYPKEINTAWDVDHKIPVSTAKTEEDIIRLNHYTNLQPLCSYTNRHIKRDKIN